MGRAFEFRKARKFKRVDAERQKGEYAEGERGACH